MTRKLCAVLSALALLAATGPAAASKWQSPHADWHSSASDKAGGKVSNASFGPPSGSSGVGPRPGKWCGWYMRTRHGGGPEMNVAWNWSRYGSAAAPQVGAIVVWRHHVGEIVGQAANGQWIILSGNDGGAVRSRPRSIAGAVIRI